MIPNSLEPLIQAMSPCALGGHGGAYVINFGAVVRAVEEGDAITNTSIHPCGLTLTIPHGCIGVTHFLGTIRANSAVGEQLQSSRAKSAGYMTQHCFVHPFHGVFANGVKTRMWIYMVTDGVARIYCVMMHSGCGSRHGITCLNSSTGRGETTLLHGLTAVSIMAFRFRSTCTGKAIASPLTETPGRCSEQHWRPLATCGKG